MQRKKIIWQQNIYEQMISDSLPVMIVSDKIIQYNVQGSLLLKRFWFLQLNVRKCNIFWGELSSHVFVSLHGQDGRVTGSCRYLPSV